MPDQMQPIKVIHLFVIFKRNTFCFSIQFLEQLLKFLVKFTLLKYVKSQRSYGFLITKELNFGFQIVDLKDHFSASLTTFKNGRCKGMY